MKAQILLTVFLFMACINSPEKKEVFQPPIKNNTVRYEWCCHGLVDVEYMIGDTVKFEMGTDNSWYKEFLAADNDSFHIKARSASDWVNNISVSVFINGKEEEKITNSGTIKIQGNVKNFLD